MPGESVISEPPKTAVGLDQLKLSEAIERLQKHIVGEHYRGYDPFDALMSPVFRLPFLRSNKLVRFGAQQVLRRIPFNWRPLLGVGKGLNPVTLGLCIQAYTYLGQVNKQKSGFYLSEIRFCIDRLQELRSGGYSGACWGYDFDWQGRYANIPAFTPTVVATGMIENGLYEYYKFYHDPMAKELILSSAEFVLKDLNRTYESDGFCFSYSPSDRQVVFNATMKGARILSHAYAISHDARFLEQAEATVRFVINHQRPDGSWPYSLGDARTWVDNFHTGYILDCLSAYCHVTEDERVHASLQSGVRFYTENLFTTDGVPKYYTNQVYPIDSTAAAQSVLTLSRLGEHDMASRVATWMIENMQDQSGYFYYQKHRSWLNRISYMRWSNAWMFVALSSLLLSLHENRLD